LPLAPLLGLGAKPLYLAAQLQHLRLRRAQLHSLRVTLGAQALGCGDGLRRALFQNLPRTPARLDLHAWRWCLSSWCDRMLLVLLTVLVQAWLWGLRRFERWQPFNVVHTRLELLVYAAFMGRRRIQHTQCVNVDKRISESLRPNLVTQSQDNH
jgi:hypothetical protein